MEKLSVFCSDPRYKCECIIHIYYFVCVILTYVKKLNNQKVFKRVSFNWNSKIHEINDCTENFAC